MIKYLISVNTVYPNDSVYLDMTKNGERVAYDIHFTIDDRWAYNGEDAKEIIYALFRGTKNPLDTIKFLIENPDVKLEINLDC